MAPREVIEWAQAQGVRLSLSEGGIRAEPRSALTLEIRGAVQACRASLIEELEREREIRQLFMLLCGDHPDYEEGVSLALANPVVHLEGLRASAAAEGLL